MIKLNINQILFELLPPDWRNKTNFQWSQTLNKGLRDAYDVWEKFAIDNYFELSHNSQVKSFEHYLSTHMGCTITISEGLWIDLHNFFFKEEIDAGYGWTTAFSFENETNPILNYFGFASENKGGNADFFVNIPSAYASPSNIDKLKSLVNKKKLGGTVYKINII